MLRSTPILVLSFVLSASAIARAQDDGVRNQSDEAGLVEFSSSKSGDSQNTPSKTGSRRRRVLIIAGLPGDPERQDRFEKIIHAWNDWLISTAGVQEDDVTVLQGSMPNDGHLPATQESIREVCKRTIAEISQFDSLWVFLLGHGSQDDRHGWFHLPGPDMNAEQWAGLFAELKAGEQVFWLTHSASGRFLKPFSRPGRIVITATDDGEVNETRFPEQLAALMRTQLGGDSADAADPQPADETNASEQPKANAENPASIDKPQSILDLFRSVSDQVSRSFDEQQLLPTEHAQLDDNGDGVGSEINDLADSAAIDSQSDAAAATIDGILAGRIILPAAPVVDDHDELHQSPTTAQP